jgi:arylsulfatase A-like enzyme
VKETSAALADRPVESDEPETTPPADEAPSTNGHAGEQVREEFAALAKAADEHAALVLLVHQHIDSLLSLCEEEGLSGSDWRKAVKKHVASLRKRLPKLKPAVH